MSELGLGDPGTHGPPPNNYGVRGKDDGLYYGYAPTISDCVVIAGALTIRYMLDFEVVDPAGNQVALIGQFVYPAASEPALALTIASDPDDPLLVHVATNRDGASIDWGDGTSTTLQGQSGSHSYGEAGTYNLIATLGSERADAWATTLPPTVPPETGPTERGM